ncbi:MAG: hypothetical protein L0Z62_20590 [Gemmataceae bacterium]|nr:hypothetical protein [Gemmataceae bacterium]
MVPRPGTFGAPTSQFNPGGRVVVVGPAGEAVLDIGPVFAAAPPELPRTIWGEPSLPPGRQLGYLGRGIIPGVTPPGTLPPGRQLTYIPIQPGAPATGPGVVIVPAAPSPSNPGGVVEILGRSGPGGGMVPVGPAGQAVLAPTFSTHPNALTAPSAEAPLVDVLLWTDPRTGQRFAIITDLLTGRVVHAQFGQAGGYWWWVHPETGMIRAVPGAPSGTVPPNRVPFHASRSGLFGGMFGMELEGVRQSVRHGDIAGVILHSFGMGAAGLGGGLEFRNARMAATPPLPGQPAPRPTDTSRFSRAIIWLAVVNAVRNSFREGANAPEGRGFEYGAGRFGVDAGALLSGWGAGSAVGSTLGGLGSGWAAAAAGTFLPFGIGALTAVAAAHIGNIAIDAARLYGTGNRMFRPSADRRHLSNFASRHPALTTLDQLEEAIRAEIRRQEIIQHNNTYVLDVPFLPAWDVTRGAFWGGSEATVNAYNAAVRELQVLNAALEELRQLRVEIQAHQDQWVGQSRLPAGPQMLLGALNVVEAAIAADRPRREETARRRAEVDRRMAEAFPALERRGMGEAFPRQAPGPLYVRREAYWRRFYEISREVGYEITDPYELRMIRLYVPLRVRREIDSRPPNIGWAGRLFRPVVSQAEQWQRREEWRRRQEEQRQSALLAAQQRNALLELGANLATPHFGTLPTIPAPPGGWLRSAPVQPSDSCDNAPTIALNTTYGPFEYPPEHDSHWFKLPAGISGDHKATFTRTTTSGAANFYYRFWESSSDCSGKFNLTSDMSSEASGSTCLDTEPNGITQPSNWIEIEKSSGVVTGTYTLRVEAGTCS